MKIGDVKVGEEYAAHDTPTSRYSRDLPRQVRVIEIVTQEERRYSAYATSPTTVNKRRLKVEFLDDTKISGSSWRRDRIRCAKKGSSEIIEARQILAPWKEMRKEITQKAEQEQKRIVLRDSLEARVAALGIGREWYRVSVSENGHVTLRFEGDEVEMILALAEAGKKS